jgi:5'-nucleotidase
VVDLVWPVDAGTPDVPDVRVRLEDVRDYPEDAAMRVRVDGHMRAVKALETAVLLPIPKGLRYSSIGTRSAQTTLGTLICNLLRDALGAEACIMNGGGIRGSREYLGHFTYGDLENEVPFDNEIVVASVPGSVLADAIAVSRSHAPRESGGFLQVDDRIFVEAASDRLLTVAGAPFDPARDYQVALVRNLFEGMDHIDPFVRFARAAPERVPPAGSGRDIKILLVEAFSKALWSQLGAFDAVDENHDGYVDANEIADAVARTTCEPASPITVDLLMRTLDHDHDHRISPSDAAPAAPKR